MQFPFTIRYKNKPLRSKMEINQLNTKKNSFKFERNFEIEFVKPLKSMKPWIHLNYL